MSIALVVLIHSFLPFKSNTLGKKNGDVKAVKFITIKHVTNFFRVFFFYLKSSFISFDYVQVHNINEVNDKMLKK